MEQKKSCNQNIRRRKNTLRKDRMTTEYDICRSEYHWAWDFLEVLCNKRGCRVKERRIFFMRKEDRLIYAECDKAVCREL